MDTPLSIIPHGAVIVTFFPLKSTTPLTIAIGTEDIDVVSSVISPVVSISNLLPPCITLLLLVTLKFPVKSFVTTAAPVPANRNAGEVPSTVKFPAPEIVKFPPVTVTGFGPEVAISISLYTVMVAVSLSK